MSGKSRDMIAECPPGQDFGLQRIRREARTVRP
jgi:hypothetical protein